MYHIMFSLHVTTRDEEGLGGEGKDRGLGGRQVCGRGGMGLIRGRQT